MSHMTLSTATSPTHVDLLLHLAQGALNARDPQKAAQLTQQALQIDTRNLPGNLLLAKATRLLGDAERAIDMCGHIRAWAPPHVAVLTELAMAQRQAGRLTDALDTYKQALMLEPQNPLLHHNLANILQRQQNWPEAESHYRQAIAAAPAMAEAHTELGNLLVTQNRVAEGRLSYARALNVRPDFQPAWQKLSASLNTGDTVQGVLDLHQHVGGTEGSNQVFMSMAQAALKLEPDNILAHFNLGIALKLAGEMEQALTPLAKVMTLPPDSPLYRQGLYFHTLCLMYLGEHGRSIEGAQRLFDVAITAPEQAKAKQLLAGLALDEGQADKALTLYRESLELDPGSLYARMSYCAAHLYAQGEEALQQPRLARDLIVPMVVAQPVAVHTNSPDTGRKLKVAYLSGDFRQHSCAYFLAPLLSNHDRTAIELFAYTTTLHEDPFTHRFMNLAGDNWRRVGHLSDEALVEQIRADGIDILVDVAGLTDGNRLTAMAHKPAPVILNWLGCLGSTGLPSIDWRVTDQHVDAPAREWEGSEPALRLDRLYVAYEAPSSAPDVKPPPMLDRGYPTFGSFNSLAKLSDSCLAMWCQVLLAVPNARLLIKSRALRDADMREALLARIAAHGVARERVSMQGWQPSTASHLETYGEVDVALDSSPFNGVTTTCEASWMGVPVVSLAGQTPAARQGLALLHAMGTPEQAAETPADFVAACVALASNRSKLAADRLTARERLKASPLMDGLALAQSMEAAYRKAWRTWCATQA
jgi:protein O-GlcNAc transferase